MQVATFNTFNAVPINSKKMWQTQGIVVLGEIFCIITRKTCLIIGQRTVWNSPSQTQS